MLGLLRVMYCMAFLPSLSPPPATLNSLEIGILVSDLLTSVALISLPSPSTGPPVSFLPATGKSDILPLLGGLTASTGLVSVLGGSVVAACLASFSFLAFSAASAAALASCAANLASSFNLMLISDLSLAVSCLRLPAFLSPDFNSRSSFSMLALTSSLLSTSEGRYLKGAALCL